MVGQLQQMVEEHAERALRRMNSLGIPRTPENYWIWYSVESGQNPELARAVETLSARKPGFSDQVNADLYERFWGSVREQDALQKATDGLKATMAELSGMVGETRSSAKGFGEHLSDATSELDEAASREAIARVAARLLQETRAVLGKTADIEKRLAVTSSRVSALDEELELVRREAMTDKLTGLGNRREFDERLRQAIAVANETKRPLTLILIDLDHFKKLNDTRGHVVGDQVLRHVGRTIARNLRDGDTGARYGGEEFALVLPGAAIEQARGLAERLRVTFDLNPLVRRDTMEEIGHVTISVGVALFRPGEYPVSFIGRADEALYAAKHGGRNRVMLEKALAEAKPAG